MNSVCAASCQAPANVFSLPVRGGVTTQRSVTDSAKQKIHDLIASAEAYLASAKREKQSDPVTELPKAKQSLLTGMEPASLTQNRCSQSALLAIRSGLGVDVVGIDSLLSDMEMVRYQVAQLYLGVQQTRLKANSAEQHELTLKNIEKMQEAIDQAAESKSTEKSRGFWGKLSNVLGVAVAVMGILLVPLTGGASLFATAYLLVDLGLQLGEQISGTRMSINSGLQVLFKDILIGMTKCLPKGTISDAQYEFYAGIASALASVIIAVAMTVLTAGGSMPKMASSIKEFLAKITAAAPRIEGAATKISVVVQTTGQLGSSAMGATSGKYGLDNAASEYRMNDISVQRENLNKERQLLMAAFEQCTEDMRKMMEGTQSDLSQIGSALSRYYASVSRMISSSSRPTRYAA